jgi:hypothetical protein
LNLQAGICTIKQIFYRTDQSSTAVNSSKCHFILHVDPDQLKENENLTMRGSVNLMEIEMIRRFLGWCVLINLGIYLYAVVVASFAQDWIYRNKAERFGFHMERPVFTIILFSMISLYKLLIIFFAVVPYIALWLCG